MAAAKRFKQNPGRTAIAYYRYSSDAQRDESIEQQRIEAHKYARDHGYVIVKEYEDHAISGTRNDRPQFNLMMYEVEQLRPAALIVWKTDRISRDRYDGAISKCRLRALGVKICYVAEAIPEDDEATEILLESLYEGMAASFIASHRKTVVRGLTYNAEHGLYNGIKVLGYTGKPGQKYEIDPVTSPIVTKIFTEYSEGVPFKKICDELNDAGLKTMRGANFNINSLRAIITNRSYIGEYRWGLKDEEPIIIPDGMPRIISDELFEKAQRMLQKNKRGGEGAKKRLEQDLIAEESPDFELTGYLYCKCGQPMHGISGTSRHGNRHYYYTCLGHKKKQCDQKNYNKEMIEDMVRQVFDHMINNERTRYAVAWYIYQKYKRDHDDGGVYIKSLESQIKEVDKRISNIIDAIQQGLMSVKLQETLQELESRYNMLKADLESEKLKKKHELSYKTVYLFLRKFTGEFTDPGYLSRLLNYFVDRIYLFDDQLMIFFKYTDRPTMVYYEGDLGLLESSERYDEIVTNIREYAATHKNDKDVEILRKVSGDFF